MKPHLVPAAAAEHEGAGRDRIAAIRSRFATEIKDHSQSVAAAAAEVQSQLRARLNYEQQKLRNAEESYSMKPHLVPAAATEHEGAGADRIATTRSRFATEIKDHSQSVAAAEAQSQLRARLNYGRQKLRSAEESYL